MSNLTILRKYATMSNPSSLPPNVLFSHSERTLTIFDAHPKAMFHFLVLARPRPPLSVFDLAGLRTLLKADKTAAREVLGDLKDEAERVKGSIEEEMLSRFGFQWEVRMGFHAVPSMEHVHLHVISSDLCSPSLKNKKHYNSFHPEHGFFLHLKDVLEWFDAEPSYFDSMSALKKSQYEPILKEDLSCWRCGHATKNIPALKAHLQEEWEKERDLALSKAQKKRKREEKMVSQPTDESAPPSKRHTSVEHSEDE